MANEKQYLNLNTRLQLKYDSYANWTSTSLGTDKGANFVLKAGEIGICYLPTSYSEQQVNGSQPPQILFKVGNGTAKFSELPWASAKAADVYDWAKQAKLPVTKDGTGNVVSGIAWDETTKGIKFTTASVATSGELENLTGRVKTIEDTFVSEQELAAAVSAINAAVEKKADKSYVDSELAKYQLKGDYATKAEAKGYADAKDSAIEAAKNTADAAVLAIGDMSSLKETAETEGFNNNIVNHFTNLSRHLQLIVTSFGETFGDTETLEQFIADINDYIQTENYDEVTLVNGLLALRTYLQELTAAFLARIGDLETLPEDKTVISILSEIVEAISNIIDTFPAMDKALDDYKTSNDAAVAEIKRTADAAKASIDTFLKSADLTADAIDTLAEIQAQLDAGEASAASLLAEVTKIKNGETVVPNATNAVNATNATKAGTASSLDAEGQAQVKAIKVDVAANAEKLGNAAASDYLKKSEATGYNDILTKTNAASTYQPKGNYATAAQGAKADTAVQPAALNDYYTKTQANAEFMNSSEVDAKITALKLGETYEPIGAETRANSYADGLAKNYATAAQGTKADSALQSIAPGVGLKVSTKSDNAQTINFDEAVIFVFNCGSSTTVL